MSSSEPAPRACTEHHVVSERDTAAYLGSGTLDVLGTPRVLAWMEHACCSVVMDIIEDGETTVGTNAVLDHLRPSGLGASIEVTAVLVAQEDRLLRFQVEAVSDGVVAARAELSRAVVNEARFLGKVSLPKKEASQSHE